MKIIKGQRANLERELLEVMLTAGAEKQAEALKTRLGPRDGKLLLVGEDNGPRDKRTNSDQDA